MVQSYFFSHWCTERSASTLLQNYLVRFVQTSKLGKFDSVRFGSPLFSSIIFRTLGALNNGTLERDLSLKILKIKLKRLAKFRKLLETKKRGSITFQVAQVMELLFLIPSGGKSATHFIYEARFLRISI